MLARRLSLGFGNFLRRQHSSLLQKRLQQPCGRSISGEMAPSKTDASLAAIPLSGSCQATEPVRETVEAIVAPRPAFLRRQGIQKQHFFNSVSSPVVGSTLLTRRQQNNLLKQDPHPPCLGAAGVVAAIADSVLVATVIFALSFVWLAATFGCLRQRLQQFNFCQQLVLVFS